MATSLVTAVTNGRRSRLVWPVRNRYGETVWLSAGQAALYLWVRAEMAHGRHKFRLAQLARVSGLDPSNVSRGLDRLASLGVVGRRSTRGCLGETTVWNVRGRAAHRRPANRRANVATSTPYGGYLTRERWHQALAAGEDRAVRRLTPPRTLYGRCAARHRVRLSRWAFRRRTGDRPGVLRSFEGVWTGRCRRCSEFVRQHENVTVRAPERSTGWSRVGDELTRFRRMPGRLPQEVSDG